MEYLLIAVLNILGIAAHAFQKIGIIRKNNPQLRFKEVLETFWFQDWNTIGFSLVVGLLLNLIGHYVVLNYAPGNVSEHPWYHVTSFALAFVIGYAGQRLIYKYLGTAESFLDKKVSEKLS